ncbi:MAG: DUF3575 domain-containing protein [Chitinophagales bacterium]|nr:DUF3575 domain-containing protein [Chitinophagales bacterium]
MKRLIFLLLTFLYFGTQIANAQMETVPSPVIKNRVIKMDFFSPLTGNITFGYEQVLANNITLEGNLGIIGISLIEDGNHAKGLFIKAGPRLYFAPDYLLDGMKRYNDFQGAYFKPEFIYSGFGFDYDNYNSQNGTYTTERGTNNSIALMLNLGKQWVLARIVTLDLHAGAGYGTSFYHYDTTAPSYGYPDSFDESHKYSHIQVPEIPLTFAAGFDIGILLK